MKKFHFFLLIINIFLSFQNSDINSNLNKTNKFPKIKCTVDQIKYKSQIYELTEEQKKNVTNKRKLQEDDQFEEIRIYLSTFKISSQLQEFDDGLIDEVLDYFNNVNKYIIKLIKVKHLHYNIQFSYSQQKDHKLNSGSVYDTTLESGVTYDLVIIPLLKIMEKNIDCQILRRDQYTNRPIIAILSIPLTLISTTGQNSQFYIESLLLHEYTHILGFLNDSFQYFPGGYNKTIEKRTLRERERYFVITPKVVNLVEKYFGCGSVKGLELEDQDDNGVPSSHWEARVLLGEYMNIEQYQPEVVMSDFTLALLEDSKWYEVNYYTGGLMRFGKNKGCNFLINPCSTSQGITSFKNEFFDFNEDENNPSCSSGRISRTYCKSTNYISGIPIKEYSYITIENKENYGGRTIKADYCFGFFQESEEESEDYLYIGNCKFGNGQYGSKIQYNNYGTLSNSLNENELKEKYTTNSFCILSEAYPSSGNLNTKYNGVIHPICYEMFCSEKSLTVKIGDQYIVCPREGGKVEVNGDFQGYIYCPDFNLICTGTVMCNDMFDCIDKESKSKTPNYDYTFNENTSSQKLSSIKNIKAIIGYELDENGKICPINCAQCKDNKKCFKCRENYNVIGVKENDDQPIKCNNTLDLSNGYFKKNEVYYPCLDFCNECSDSTTCNTCDNYHKLNNDKTKCIEKVEFCEEYDNVNFGCIKCIPGYAFLKNDKENCLIISNKETHYFTLDGGISYYPCDTNITNCDECNNMSDRCSKCKNGYYFIDTNRTYCFNNIQLDKYYYTDDNGISYKLCNKTIQNCQFCTYNSNLKCDLCEKDYYFIENNKEECFNNYDLRKYYTEDNGISYFPCNNAFPQCEICNNKKNQCDKCFDGYYFIGLNKEKCENNADSEKYFTEDNGISYLPCDTYMEGCEKCSNRSYCTSCKNDYYFIENKRNMCFYKIDLEHYYKEGDDYFPCNKSIEYCNICNVKDSCIQCNQNYYFIGNDKTKCETGKNLRKYYTNDNGLSYFLCNTTMEYCDECYNDNFCYLCQNLYFLKFENSRECFLEENLKKDKTYYRFNVTHYKRCSDNIANCEFCSSSQFCDQCLPNNYFLDDDFTECVNIMNINIEEYYQYDMYNYHKCSWLFDNCQKCDGTMCNLCFENFTLVNDNYKNCYPKENYKIGYYQNSKGNMFYPCIDNCDICTNGIVCIQCAINYSPLGDGTSCGACMIAEVIINDELSMENMDKLVQTYINNYKNNYDVAMVYSNPNINLTLTIFRTWQCTELLYNDKYYRININEFIQKLRKKMNKSERSFIYYMLNYNYKSYFEVYDVDLNRKIDIKNECQECLRVEYEIKNNYSYDISHILGSKVYKVANNYNINPLNATDTYYSDTCKNVEIESIDISVEQRREIFYLGSRLKKITCLDDDCTLNSIFYNESTGICQCKLNFDFENLFTNSTDDNSNNEDLNTIFNPISNNNPFPIFKCSKEAFNSKNISKNPGLYIGCVAIVIQILCFLILSIKYCIRKKLVKNIASPPPKDILTLKKKYLIKDDTEKETVAKDKDYDSFYDSADTEKKVQERDEEEIDEESQNDENLNSKYFKDTQILSEENSFSTEKKNDLLSSKRKLKDFNFEKINPDEDENNFSKLSEIKRKNTEELDYTSKKSSDKSSTESLDLSEDEIFTLVKNSKEKLELDYVVLAEAIKKDERTIGELYTHLLALKQPIWDMLSEIRALQINKSFIPLSMKIIRFFFMLCFNMFINSLFLTQKYFRKKYTYFNNKYNLQYNENIINISSNDKFGYAIKHTIGYAWCTFFICIIVQFVINYYLFNVRKKVWVILKEYDNNTKEEIKELNIFFNRKNLTYIWIVCINFVLLIVFFFYIINFSQAYKGGVVDYVGGTLMTWIFLQIIPFISCLISALFRYYGLKKQNNRLYKLNQVYIY